MHEDFLTKLYKDLEENQFSNQRIKDIRILLYGLTQKKFAALLGVKLVTYRSWEWGCRYPSSPATALLSIAEANPDFFIKNRKSILNQVYKESNFPKIL